MIPKINDRGHSFKGVTAYLMHDKKAQTSERVAWSDTGNMHTRDIEKAALVMAYTDKNADSLKRSFGGSAAGRKSEAGNVYHFSLSWAKEENPSQQHQYEQVLETLERLGLSKHQYYMVAHKDTEHDHVHTVVNLVNPETGKVHTPSFDKRELQAWALEYEQKHIMHCPKREENAQKREQGQQVKHQEQKQDYSENITRAYYASDNGKAFINALKEEGLELAKARRGYNFVIVDNKGDIQKLSRQLNIEERGKLKTEAIQNLLKDIDRKQIQDGEVLAKTIKQELAEKHKPYDRDAQEVQQQTKLADAADKAAATKAREQEQSAKSAKEELKKTETALQAKRAAYEQESQAHQEKEYQRQYQRNIDQKTEESRKKWDIDGFITLRDQARQDLQDNSGFIARITGKKQAAADKLEAQEKTLQERLWRFEGDINTINAERSPEIQQRELKKQGFETKTPHPREAIAPVQTNKEKANNIEKTKTIQAKTAEQEQAQSQASKMPLTPTKPIKQTFNKIGELRGPEELEKTIATMQAQDESKTMLSEQQLSKSSPQSYESFLQQSAREEFNETANDNAPSRSYLDALKDQAEGNELSHENHQRER